MRKTTDQILIEEYSKVERGKVINQRIQWIITLIVIFILFFAGFAVGKLT